LLDFDKPLPPPKLHQSVNNNLGKNNEELNQIWTEEFIKEATSQFEKKMREYASQQGVGASSSQSQAAAVHKVVEAAAQAAVGESKPGFSSSLNEAIKSIATNPELMENPLGLDDNDLSKLMSSFSLGDTGGEAEMDEILPFMTNMMQKLLSKELLQPVLTDIVDRYPDWLADNRTKLAGEDFEKYNRQYEFMKRICEEYAAEKETDSEEVKQLRFDRISELMLKVQYAGPPPKELVGDLGPIDESGMPNFNLAAAGLGDQCSIM